MLLEACHLLVPPYQHVSRLRKKLGNAVIETERGMGYRLARP